MWFNPIMASVLRSPFHGLLSQNTMLITVLGKRTGRRLTTPVNYFRRGDELLTVSLRSRKWWRNPRGGVLVGLLLAGYERKAFASVAESDSEIRRGLADIIASSPSMSRPLAIGLDQAGRPNPADLARASAKRVIVRARLTPVPS
jgi:hypothetical protein